MKDLGIKLFSEAHVDPDLNKSILKDRPSNWRGLFGQSGGAQATLHNENVREGDIFLFFGCFQEATKLNGKWKYVNNSPEIHSIFGYLEVDKVYDISAGDSVPEWAEYHPHIKNKEDYGQQRNSVYMATNTFSKDPSKPGWGTFEYNTKLTLTKSGAKLKSIWELPPCFKNEAGNFKQANKDWKINELGNVEFQQIGRGSQEVFFSENPEVIAWVETLIKTCNIYE